mmetsp:Transcript_50029/g.98836  ORF Transcript_50029/g.98836 Transcript_50029/m.98836 type:complete len:717 (-) Transcript_50029:202-2352(-)
MPKLLTILLSLAPLTRAYLLKLPRYKCTRTFASLSEEYEAKTPPTQKSSLRLRRARLRLVEAQGRIGPGVADILGAQDPLVSGDIDAIPPATSSFIRDFNFTRVAEPENAYDPAALQKRLWRQPLLWLKRNIELFFPLVKFALVVALDIQKGKEKENRSLRAKEVLAIVSTLGPAIIKGGQALASRPDLLPKEYLDQLQRLQDRLPPFPKEEAFAMVEAELGVPFSSVFELEEPEPVAAASIGQVFKGRLIANGDQVAIKIQRPGCEEIIGLDLYILRWYADILTNLLAALGRKINLVSVIDDFGELIYREIDYRAEAGNARRFGELYATIPDVYVPRVYPDLCSSKVLTMEWVDGVRLVEEDKLEALGLDSSKLVDTLIQCSLRQMLDNGFFHADPHAGNLLATPAGKLVYLDFGMMSYVETYQRYAIIEAVVHLVNRDFEALGTLYMRMGFIPPDTELEPIVLALEDALPDVLDASVGDLNLKNVINSLGDVFFQFPFSLPAYYIALIRCLGVLEGLALQVDPNVRIVSEAYPYISSRLLTDSSPELQAALQQLLFKEEKPRWDRLSQLVDRASERTDYNMSQVGEKLFDFLISSEGLAIREELIKEVIQGTEDLGEEVSTIFEHSLASSRLPSEEDFKSSARLNAVAKVATAVASSKSLDFNTILPLARRIAGDPVARQAGIDIAAAVSERGLSRLIRRAFALSSDKKDAPDY